jgi:hypothetical protein
MKSRRENQMTRAVAERGAKLIEGVHRSRQGPVITIKQANGIVTEVLFDETDGATPVLIEAMVMELHIEDPKLRDAVRGYCLSFLKGWEEIVGDPEDAYNIPLDEFYTRAEAFMAGYKAAS